MPIREFAAGVKLSETWYKVFDFTGAGCRSRTSDLLITHQRLISLALVRGGLIRLDFVTEQSIALVANHKVSIHARKLFTISAYCRAADMLVARL